MSLTGRSRHERLPKGQHDLLVHLLGKEKGDPEVMAEDERRDWRVTGKPWILSRDGFPDEPRNIVSLYYKGYIVSQDHAGSLAGLTYDPAKSMPTMGIHEFRLTRQGREYLEQHHPTPE